MLKRIYQHYFLIATVLSAVLCFFFLKRLDSDAPKVTDMAALVVCCALFSWTAIASVLEDLERKLNKWLEPKTGYAQQVDLERHKLKKWQESVEGYAQQASAPTDPYPQRSHRHDLEHSLVHALAPSLVNHTKAGALGNFIREVADAILGAGSVNATQVFCKCGSVAGCTCTASPVLSENPKPIWATAGAQADQAAEAEIVAAGLTAPRVTAEQIQALIDGLKWRYEHQESPQIIFAHAFLGDFYLATGFSKPVSAENFSPALGMKYAREQAEGKARDKLWELEGYALFKQLA